MGIQINGQTDTISAFDNSFSLAGNVSIGGTLTYEDVTSVDAVGLSTFQAGIHLDDSIIHLGDTNTKIRFPAADTITAETAGSERLRITSTGDVGIGTDNPATNFKLDVNGDLSLGELGGSDNTYIDQKQNGQLDIINSGRSANNGKVRINKTNSISGDTTYFRDFEVYDGKNNLVLLTDGSSGNIGITTANPSDHNNFSKALDINGPSGSAVYMRTNGSTSNAFIVGNYGSEAYLNNLANGNIRFFTNGSEKLRLTNAGDVGIGTAIPITGSGYASLSLADTSGGQIEFKKFGAQTHYIWSDNNLNIGADYSGTGQNLVFKVNGNNERLRITSAGDVVIGTTAAARGPLHIHKNSADCYLHVTNSTTGTGSGDGFTIHQSGVETLLNNRESGNMRLYTNGGEKVRITSSGRVLVGQSISQALSTVDYCDVDFHCTGPLSVGSNSNTNQAEVQRVGRRVINLYHTSYSSSGGPYLHLETSLWGGGSPHGNTEFIMGGFHIHGYRYNNPGVSEEIIYFHNWSGSLYNYSRYHYGNWDPGSSCYVGSNGNVYIRLPNTAYYGFTIDLTQHPWYSVRDITILNATFSTSTSL